MDSITNQDLIESFSIELNSSKQFKINVTEACSNVN